MGSLYILIFIPLMITARRFDEPFYDYSDDSETSSPLIVEVPGWARKNFYDWLSHFEDPQPEEYQTDLSSVIQEYQTNPRSIIRSHIDYDGDQQTRLYPRLRVPEWARRGFLAWIQGFLWKQPQQGQPSLTTTAPNSKSRLRSHLYNDLRANADRKVKIPGLKKRTVFSRLKSILRDANSLPENPSAQSYPQNIYNVYNADETPVLRMSFDNGIEDQIEVSSLNDNEKDVSNNEVPVESLDPKSFLRTKHKNKKKHKDQKKPEWVKDMKEFVKDLTTQYSQQEVLERTKPIIRSIEKKQHVKIKDIDVDEYGEIHITYTEKGRRNKKSTRTGNQADET